jgi:hypothetical protein
MTLILDASAPDETVHRVKVRQGTNLITYCGKEVQVATARQPRRAGLPKCRRCWSYYAVNLGKQDAALASTQTSQENRRKG